MNKEDKVELVLSLIHQWTLEYGNALVPGKSDTYGDGMRQAKETVSNILKKLYE
jgi:hypothetical protein